MTESACPFRLDPTARDTHAEASRLRESGSVVRVVLPGDVEAWSVTDYNLLKTLLNDSRVSKDPAQHWPTWIDGGISSDWPLFLWVAVKNMFTAYGKDHMRLRKLVAKGFTPRRIAAMRPRIEEITETLLKTMASLPAGEPVDLRAELAHPLPIKVICELIGVPEDSHERLRRVVDTVFDSSAAPQEAQAAQRGLYELLTDLVAAKREAPGDDMTSDLIVARNEDDGSALSEAELLDTLLLILSAGFETTVNLLDNAVYALLTHPGQLELVQTGQVTWEDVIDETLRWQAPIPHLPLRYAVDDIELGGVTIHKGDAILPAYGAAGRDPHQHGETAAAFDVTRTTRRDHMAFGYGAHYCLGAALAKLEAAVALPALLARFPDLALAVPAAELEPVGSMMSNGHKTLPVRYQSTATVG